MVAVKVLLNRGVTLLLSGKALQFWIAFHSWVSALLCSSYYCEIACSYVFCDGHSWYI